MGFNITSVDSKKLPYDFHDFIRQHEKYLSILGLNYNQSDFIGDEMNFIGRFENLHTDYLTICKTIGITSRKPLEHTRQSMRERNYRLVYDDEMIDIVGSIFRRDIEKFNYTFK
jgi:hypothetical protein